MNQKYYIKLNNLFNEKNLDELISDYLLKKEKYQDLKFTIICNNNELMETKLKYFDDLIEHVKNKGVDSSDIIIAGKGSETLYSYFTWLKIKALDKHFQKSGVVFGFEDMNKTWTVKEVENANAQIEKIAKKFKEKKLSPYEKLLGAYLTVVSKTYNQDLQEHPAQPRSVFGVLNSDKVVCVGYSVLLQAIMEQVGEENIKIYQNHVAISYDNSEINSLHQDIIVYIKDEKYGLNGYYFLDPTIDNPSKSKDANVTLNAFLVPVKDIKNIKKHLRNFQIPRESELFFSEEMEKRRRESSAANMIAYNNNQNINRVNSDILSFSSDKYVISKEFALDLFKRFPDLKYAIEYELKDKLKELNLPQYETPSLLLVKNMCDRFKEMGITRMESGHFNWIVKNIGTSIMADNHYKVTEIFNTYYQAYTNYPEARKKVIENVSDSISKQIDKTLNYYEQKINDLQLQLNETEKNDSKEIVDKISKIKKLVAYAKGQKDEYVERVKKQINIDRGIGAVISTATAEEKTNYIKNMAWILFDQDISMEDKVSKAMMFNETKDVSCLFDEILKELSKSTETKTFRYLDEYKLANILASGLYRSELLEKTLDYNSRSVDVKKLEGAIESVMPIVYADITKEGSKPTKDDLKKETKKILEGSIAKEKEWFKDSSSTTFSKAINKDKIC